MPTLLHEWLRELVDRHRQDHRGTVATYIPELGKANPDWFGAAIVTTDGATYLAGDHEQTFTIQSISKPLTYALALEKIGSDEVLRRVGVEPSGEAFNSISLRPDTGTPLNPMINAGAIAVSSLVQHRCGPKPLESMMQWFSTFAHRQLDIDQVVYESERDTGHRNRAIAHMLRNFGVVTDPVEAGLDLYFQQCSILVTCRDLAMMAATLANQGVQPHTHQQVIAPELVDDVLSVMTTCGMYDYAGQWLYDVGLPAKSGVSGGIMAVLPGRMGIGFFSPRLDEHGNSVRGIAACKELSERFGLHLFRTQRTARNTLRRELTLDHRHSTCARTEAENHKLKHCGRGARVFELQGDLEFTGMEVVQRKMWEALPQTQMYVVDISRLDSVHPSAAQGLASMIKKLRASGRHVVLATTYRKKSLTASLLGCCDADACFDDIDDALEACEDHLLGGNGQFITPSDKVSAVTVTPTPLALHELEIMAEMTAEELNILEQVTQEMHFAPHQPIFRRGDAADHIYFLTHGRISVRLYTSPEDYHPLASFNAGHVFGEMSVLDTGTRSADVWTESPVICRALSTTELERLADTHPQIKIKLLQHLLRITITRLRKANDQIEHLAR